MKMSDSEDFLLKINAEELFPEITNSPSSKKRKVSKTRKKKKRKMKISKLIPNHFIAFRIQDFVIRNRIEDIQKKIIQKNPFLSKALIDLRTLHVTLAVTHLENDERIAALQERLQDWGENDMKTHFSEPIRLTFKGMGTFGKKVAYVKIDKCENYKRLCTLSAAVNELLSNSGFYSESKTFTPHLTVLKLSRDYNLFKKIKKDVSNEIEVLNECQDEFGSQDVNDIQLLSMTAKKDDSGYYKCLWEVKTKEEPKLES